MKLIALTMNSDLPHEDGNLITFNAEHIICVIKLPNGMCQINTVCGNCTVKDSLDQILNQILFENIPCPAN